MTFFTTTNKFINTETSAIIEYQRLSFIIGEFEILRTKYDEH